MKENIDLDELRDSIRCKQARIEADRSMTMLAAVVFYVAGFLMGVSACLFSHSLIRWIHWIR
jgi:hypothetical protein